MKTLNTIQKLAKIGRVLSQIAFVCAVVAFCGCVAGLLSATLGNGDVIRWGGVTLHGIIAHSERYDLKGISAALAGLLFICAGEAVLAKFAACYFKNEVKAGTPFTLSGAKELLHLGILTVAIPLGCALAANITEGILAGYMPVDRELLSGFLPDNEGSITLGIMFMLMSLLCRHGAEQKEA